MVLRYRASILVTYLSAQKRKCAKKAWVPISAYFQLDQQESPHFFLSNGQSLSEGGEYRLGLYPRLIERQETMILNWSKKEQNSRFSLITVYLFKKISYTLRSRRQLELSFFRIFGSAPAPTFYFTKKQFIFKEFSQRYLTNGSNPDPLWAISQQPSWFHLKQNIFAFLFTQTHI